MRLPTVAAVVLPLLLLAAELWWLTRPVARAVSPLRRANDAALQAAPPGIVLVGNSKSDSDLDAKLLARELGYSGAVTTVLVSASSAPAWYALLEQRVFAQGYTPELVIVYGQLGALLRTEVGTTSERTAVEDELDTDSPVLDAKVFRRRGGPLALARANASAAHDAVLTGLRDLSLGLFVAPPGPGGLRAAGAALAGPALEEVFGKNAAFHADASPRLIAADALAAAPLGMRADNTQPVDSLIPDMVALAKAHSAAIAFVRSPLPVSTAYEDQLPQATERAAADLFEVLGASWIDLHDVELPAGAWRDNYHLGRSGEAALTRALAARLSQAEVLAGGIARSRPVLVPTVSRSGSVTLPDVRFLPIAGSACAWRSALPGFAHLGENRLIGMGLTAAPPFVVTDGEGALRRYPGRDFGNTCDGSFRFSDRGLEVSPRRADVTNLRVALADTPSVPARSGPEQWWIYPGTHTVWRFTEAWEGPLTVTVEARVVGEGSNAELRVGDRRVPLVAAGRLLRASVTVEPAAGAWEVSVAASADTWLVVDELRLGEVGPQRLVGQRPVTLNAIAGRLEAPAPAPVPVGAVEVDTTVVRYLLPELEALSDDALRTRVGFPCSPVQAVGAEGVVWTAAHRPLPLIKGVIGSFGHIGGALVAALPGPVGLRFDPARACLSRRWVYAKDRVSWTVGSGGPAAQLRLGADRLVVDAQVFGARATLSIQVGSRGEGAAQEVILEGPRARVCLPIDPPMPPRTPMVLVVSGDPTVHVLLESVAIGESEHLACPK